MNFDNFRRKINKSLKIDKNLYQKMFYFSCKVSSFLSFSIIQRRQKCQTLKVFKDQNSFTNYSALRYRKKLLTLPMTIYIIQELVSLFVPKIMINDLKILGFCLT